MHHVADAHYYVAPDAVREVPSGTPPAEYVKQLDAAGDSTPGDTGVVRPLETAVGAFFDSPTPLLLVLGEPGMGKTVFTWRTAHRWHRQYQAALRSPGPGRGKEGACCPACWPRGTT